MSRMRTFTPALDGGISIVLPARNEATNIVSAVEKSLAAAQRLTSRYEVIVVDDGSIDGTGQVVQTLVQQHPPHVRLLTHAVNQGYGAALRDGFRQASFELVFFTDSDNQFDVSDLEKFAPLIADHDIVAGFRIDRNDPFIRSVYSWFYNRFVGALFGLRVRDVNCAFKLMRREVTDQVTIECNNFFVNAELLAKARRRKFRIAEMGVRHYPRTAGKTTVRMSDVPTTLMTALRTWHRMNRTARTDERTLPVTTASESVPVRR